MQGEHAGNTLSSFFDLLRVVMVVSICWAHVPIAPGYAVTIGDGMLGPLFKDVLSRAGVPMLTVVAGYLACASLQRKGVSGFYWHKVRRLALPFVVWNVAALLVLWLLSWGTGYVVPAEILVYDSPAALFASMFGTNRIPLNAPLYFLRDLFLVALLTPLMGRLAVSVVASLLFVLVVTVCALQYVQVAVSGHVLLYRIDMLLFYFVGYALAWRNVDMPRFRPAAAFAATVSALMGCVLVAWLLVRLQPELSAYLSLRPLFGWLAVLCLPALYGVYCCVWHVRGVALLQALSPCAFHIFLTHQITAYVILILIVQYAPEGAVFEAASGAAGELRLALFLVFYTLACVLVGVLVRLVLLKRWGRGNRVLVAGFSSKTG